MYHSLCPEFVRRGHGVTVYSRLIDGLAAEEVDERGIHHVRLPAWDWWSHKAFTAVDSLRWCWRTSAV